MLHVSVLSFFYVVVFKLSTKGDEAVSKARQYNFEKSARAVTRETI